MTTNTNGLATALELAGGIGDADQAGDQSEMFDCGADLPVQRAKSGPNGGRPVGSRNKTTEQWRQYLLSKYTSPLIGLMEIYSRTALEIAQHLDLRKRVLVEEAVEGKGGEQGTPAKYGWRWDLEAAFRIQQDSMKAALPYLHQRQPLAIEQKGDKRGLLLIGDLTQNFNAGGGDRLPLPNNEEKQDVIDLDAEQHLEKSDDEKSESDENASDINN